MDVWLLQDSELDERMKVDLEDLKRIPSLDVPDPARKFGTQRFWLILIFKRYFFPPQIPTDPGLGLWARLMKRAIFPPLVWCSGLNRGWHIGNIWSRHNNFAGKETYLFEVHDNWFLGSMQGAFTSIEWISNFLTTSTQNMVVALRQGKSLIPFDLTRLID